MKAIKKLNKWANSHAYYPIDIIRITLGVFLIYKGISFIKDFSHLEELLVGLDDFTVMVWMVHYVGMFHFVGGILLIFGLLTRVVLIVQLPIFIGAVTINFFSVFQAQSFAEALIVLIVSLFFILYGSGKHSIDYDLKMQT
ncbi:MAG: DoxX family protein [Urechidicola sp.]|nr:DoxX family protein [Urechidicola sp.]